MMKKRVISLLLVLAMVFAMLPTTFAASEYAVFGADGEKLSANDTVALGEELTITAPVERAYYYIYADDENVVGGIIFDGEDWFTVQNEYMGKTLTFYFFENRDDYLDNAIENAVVSLSVQVEMPPVVLQTVDGAQIRTTGKQGLRFTSIIQKGENFGEVKEYGTLLIPAAAVVSYEDIIIGAQLSGYTVAKVPAVRKYAEDENSVTFTAVLTDIATKNYHRAYTARAYAIMEDDTVVYGLTSTSRSCLMVANKIRLDENVSASDKAAAEGIFEGLGVTFAITGHDGTAISDAANYGDCLHVTPSDSVGEYFYDWFLGGEYYTNGRTTNLRVSGEWTLYVYTDYDEYMASNTDAAIYSQAFTVVEPEPEPKPEVTFTVTDENGDEVTTVEIGETVSVTPSDDGEYYYHWVIDDEFYASPNPVRKAGEWVLYVFDNLDDLYDDNLEAAIFTYAFTVVDPNADPEPSVSFRLTDTSGNDCGNTAYHYNERMITVDNGNPDDYFFAWYWEGTLDSTEQTVRLGSPGNWTCYVYDNQADFDAENTENAVAEFSITVMQIVSPGSDPTL